MNERRTRRVRVGTLLADRGPWMSTNQVSRALGISRYTAHRYAVAGLFPGAVMLSGRRIIIPVRAVEDFLRARTILGPRKKENTHEDNGSNGAELDRRGFVGPAARAAGEPAAAVGLGGGGAAGSAPGA